MLTTFWPRLTCFREKWDEHQPSLFQWSMLMRRIRQLHGSTLFLGCLWCSSFTKCIKDEEEDQTIWKEARGKLRRLGKILAEGSWVLGVLGTSFLKARLMSKYLESTRKSKLDLSMLLDANQQNKKFGNLLTSWRIPRNITRWVPEFHEEPYWLAHQEQEKHF